MDIRVGGPPRKQQARPRHPVLRRKTQRYEAAFVQPLPRSRRRRAEEGGAQPRVEVVRPVSLRQPEAERIRSATPSRLLQAVRSRWWSLMLLAGLTAALAYCFGDSRFFVYAAEVAGADHLSGDVVYRAAGVHKQSVFWIDPREVAERVVLLDGVRTARVRCSLPATVAIEVEERQPVVLWRSLPAGRDYWLDEEGVVLPYHGDPQSAQTVFVVDSTERRLEVGDRIEPTGLVQSVLQMEAALSGARVFYYQSERGLSFTQEAGGGQWPVYVGTSRDLEAKIQVVSVLTEYLTKNSIRPSYVDVRWANRPVYGMPGMASREGGN